MSRHHMTRRTSIVFACLISLALLLVGVADAAALTLHGTVVRRLPAARSFVIADRHGDLRLVHARIVPGIARSVSVDAQREGDGSFRAVSVRVGPRRRRVRLHGRIATINPRTGRFTVSDQPASVSVRRRRHRTHAVAGPPQSRPPASAGTGQIAPGDRVTVDAVLTSQGPVAVTVQGDGGGVASSAGLAPSSASLASLPDTWDGIHLGLAFDYHVMPLASLTGRVDYVWGASEPTLSATATDYYVTYARDQTWDSHHDLAWWQANHPDWIVYRCDGVTPAYDDVDGDPLVPLDITNPDVRQYQFEQISKGLDDGYGGVAFDNLEATNWSHRCGVYRNGAWTPLGYPASGSNAKYVADIVDWAHAMHDMIKASFPNARISMNLSAGSSGEDFVIKLAPYLDNVYDEGASKALIQNWQTEIESLEFLVSSGKAAVIDGYPYPVDPSRTGGLTQAELLWILANYLLVKGHNTYVYAYDAYAVDGGFIDRPEYATPIGHPTSARYASQGVYMRDYSGGLAVVNPTHAAVDVALPHSYYDTGGHALWSLAMQPMSGAVLLTTP